MNKGLFAALASVALLGASCSVQDFSTVVMDKPTITADIDTNAYGFGTPSDNGLMQLEVGDVITSLFVGNPKSNYYTLSNDWVIILRLTDGTNDIDFVCPPPNDALFNRIAISGNNNTFFDSVRYDDAGLVKEGNIYVFGGDDSFVSGVNTNRDVTIYFNKPLTVSQATTIPVTHFACPLAHRSYQDGYYDAERDNGLFNHAYYVTGNDGTNTVTNFIDSSLLEWYTSVNTQGLFDPYSLVSFLGLSSSATSYTITIQYGEVYSVETFPLAAFPLYVDVLKGGEVEDSALLPSLTISRYRGGSIRGYTLFDAVFSNSYAGLATGYPNPDVYNREYDSFNRISLYLPKNQSYADMRQIGVVSPYAAGFADGVTSRNGEVDDLTQRILDLQNDLSQYQGKDYQQIYNLGFQAGLDENAQGAATFNSLFGNILTAPLTILNGLTDISFFGMPILTAILSLLMVAMALFLFKRFK